MDRGLARYIGDAMHTYVQQRSGNENMKPVIIGFVKLGDVGNRDEVTDQSPHNSNTTEQQVRCPLLLLAFADFF